MATRDGFGYTYRSENQVAEPVAITLSNLTPAEDTVLAYTQGVQFDLTVPSPAVVTEAGGARVCVWVRFPDMDNRTEVVFDGTAFTATYDDDSTITAISDGLRFLVYRNGGWISKPTFFVHAVSDLGGTNT